MISIANAYKSFIMNKLVIFFFFSLSLILFLSNDLAAQKRSSARRKSRKIANFKGVKVSFKEKRYLAIGANLNSLNYFGDLAPKSGIGSTDISFTRPGFGLSGHYRMGPQFAIRTDLNWGRLRGDDSESADPYDVNGRFRYVRNLSFRNDIKELNLMFIFDLFKNKGTYITRVLMTPYIAGGIGIVHHNPMGLAPSVDDFGQPLAEAGKWVALKPLGTEGQLSDEYNVDPYSNFLINIPLAVGMRFKMTQNFDLAFEIGYRHLFSDYIDDVSNYYVDPGVLDGPLARTMADRSREPVTSVSNIERDQEAISQVTREVPIISKFTGETFTRYGGYGYEHPENNRGHSTDNDIYLITSIKLTYILSGSFRNAKFR